MVSNPFPASRQSLGSRAVPYNGVIAASLPFPYRRELPPFRGRRNPTAGVADPVEAWPPPPWRPGNVLAKREARSSPATVVKIRPIRKTDFSHACCMKGQPGQCPPRHPPPGFSDPALSPRRGVFICRRACPRSASRLHRPTLRPQRRNPGREAGALLPSSACEGW